MTDYDDEQPTSWLELADEFAGLADGIDRRMRERDLAGERQDLYQLGCANGYRTAAERIRYLLPRLGPRPDPSTDADEDPVDQHAQEAKDAVDEWPSRLSGLDEGELRRLAWCDPARFLDQARSEAQREAQDGAGERAAMWIQAGWSAARAAAMGLGEDAQVDAARRIVEGRDGG